MALAELSTELALKVSHANSNNTQTQIQIMESPRISFDVIEKQAIGDVKSITTATTLAVYSTEPITEVAPRRISLRSGFRKIISTIRSKNRSQSVTASIRSPTVQNTRGITQCSASSETPAILGPELVLSQETALLTTQATDYDSQKENPGVSQTTCFLHSEVSGGSTRSDIWQRVVSEWKPQFSGLIDLDESEIGSSQNIQLLIGRLQSKAASRTIHKVLNRIQPFLGRLSNYGGALDTFAQAHPVLTLLWGSFKTLILISSRFDEIYNNVSEVFEQLERSMGVYDIYLEEFPQSQRVQEAIADFFSAIVSFTLHSCQLLNTNPVGPLLLKVWSDDRKRRKESLDRIENKRQAIIEEANAAKVQADSLFKKEIKTRLTTLETTGALSVNRRASPKIYPCHVIPLPRNSKFRGREDFLQEMSDLLLQRTKAQTSPQSLTLCGLGGMGKTQTALEFVYRHREAIQIILWASADTPLKLEQAFVGFACALGLIDEHKSHEFQRRSIVEKVKTRLSNSEIPWLLVFDNVEDAKLVGSFLPTDANGFTLFTTRNNSHFSTVARVTRTIRPLCSEESVNLMLSQISPIEATIKPSDEDLKMAADLCHELGGLPLAITQIANFISNTQCTITEVLSLFRKKDNRALLDDNYISVDPYYTHTLSTVWDLTFSKLDEKSARFLDILAFLDPDQIPEALFLERSSNHENDPSFLPSKGTHLKMQAIIERQPQSKSLSIHRLIKDRILMKLANDEDKWSQAFNTAINLLSEKFPKQKKGMPLYDEHIMCNMYSPHVQAVSELYKRQHDRASSLKLQGLLHNLTWFMFEKGSWTNMLKYTGIALTVLNDIGLSESLEAGFILNTIGNYCIETSQCAEAARYHTRVLKIRQSDSSSDDYDISNTLHNIAFAYAGLRDFNQANQACDEAIRIRENLPDTEFNQDFKRKMLPSNYTTKCRILYLSGDLERAEKFGLKAVEAAETGHGIRHQRTTQAYYSIADVFYRQNKVEEALAYHEKALDIRRDILGQHYKTAASYYKVAMCHLSKEPSIALKGLSDVVQMYRKLHFVEAPLARALYHLSSVLEQSGEWAKAQAAKTEAKALLASLGGKDLDAAEAYDEVVSFPEV